MRQILNNLSESMVSSVEGIPDKLRSDSVPNSKYLVQE